MAQIAPLTDLTSTWPYPLESDGWYRAHDALRADLAALDAMLNAFQRQLLAGTLISHEQAAAATAFYNAFVKTLHHHHQNEDGERPHSCSCCLAATPCRTLCRLIFSNSS